MYTSFLTIVYVEEKDLALVHFFKSFPTEFVLIYTYSSPITGKIAFTYIFSFFFYFLILPSFTSSLQ